MSSYKIRKLKNILFHFLLMLSAVLVITPLFMIFIYLFKMGASSLNLDFFTQAPKPVGETGGGMVHAIIGSSFVVSIGGILAIPLGICGGIYLSEFGKNRLASILRYTTDLMTGIPSIVIGIFAYLIIVVPLKGFSALAGGFALSLIILPIVIKSTEEILKLVPNHIREAGLALGLPRWKVIYHIILKGNASAILTGVILAISRAAGETAPLLFTSFGSLYLSYNLTQPMASLPVQIYNYAISPFDDWRRQAWAGAFVLICIVLGLNLLARLIVSRTAILAKYRAYKEKRSRG
jgi:phosphate transport system permease protein